MTTFRYDNAVTRALTPLHTYGPHLNGDRGRFTLWCKDADTLDLLIYENNTDLRPLKAISLNPTDHRFGDTWTVEVPGVKSGYCYVWKVNIENGKDFLEEQFVLDPYAPAISGAPAWGQTLIRQPGEPLHTGPAFPKALILDEKFSWGNDSAPGIAWEDMVVYEAHVRGMTAGPGSGVQHPGTYAGLEEKIPYLKKLGITTLELLPVFEFDEMEYYHHNDRRANLRNFWGYSTLGFFAPNGRYAAGGTKGQQVNEFKSLVKALHKAGIEVILDVVFNHTAENGQGGNAYHFKVLGKDTYYIYNEEHGHYNYSGCGNTVNCNHPVVRQFILDSLRHWVMEYHVDGFRFDLASILCRGRDGSLLASPPLIEEIDEDPILQNTKMIAEAWDAAGAYHVGNFPSSKWSEWNGKYRDDIRRFWSGEPGMLSAFATRILGS
jgi:glycogen operon protein